MKKYYIATNEVQSGPYSIEEVKRLNINSTTMIWYSGMDDWKMAKELPELNHLFEDTPPPLNFNNAKPKDIPRVEKISIKDSFTLSKSQLRILIIVMVLLISISTMIIVYNKVYTGRNKETNYNEEEYQVIENNTESNSNNETNSSYEQDELSEQELRDKLYDTELQNPLKYLSVDGTYNVNLAANTIINGKISNFATNAGFKNVRITAKFYSKTDMLLQTETFTVMEFVEPNQEISFRHKIYGWWTDTDHWTMDIVDAEGY